MPSIITDKFVDPKVGYNNSGLPILNIKHGGQWGYAPNLSQIESSTTYVPRDLTILMVKAPEAFNYFDDKKIWVEGLRSLVETHSYSTTGFNHTLTLETTDVPIGSGGEIMKVPVDSKRTPTDITMNFRELEGQSISRYLEAWIRICIWDPDVNHPLISTMGIEDLPEDWLLSQYGMTILAFEPNTHFTKVQRAWIVTGMFPLSSGEVIGSREPGTAKNIREMAIQFSGVAESNEGTRVYAQEVMDKMNVTGGNPYNTKSTYNEADINLMLNTDVGYTGTLDYIKDNQIEEG